MRGLLLTMAMLTAGAADAQTRGGFTLGAEVFYYGYRERLDGVTVVRDDGAFGGFTLDYVETIGGGSFLRARIASSWGSVDYRSDDGERLDGVDQDITQVELHYGRDFALGQMTLTPFAGLGGRLLVDNSGGRVTAGGFEGYDREVSYSYFPLGATLAAPIGKQARFVASAQVNLLYAGDVQSKFSKVDPALPNVTVDLRGGTGLEAGAALALPLGRREIAFGPFVRHWRVQRSKEHIVSDAEGAVAFFEPHSRTTELGLRLSLAF